MLLLLPKIHTSPAMICSYSGSRDGLTLILLMPLNVRSYSATATLRHSRTSDRPRPPPEQLLLSSPSVGPFLLRAHAAVARNAASAPPLGLAPSPAPPLAQRARSLRRRRRRHLGNCPPDSVSPSTIAPRGGHHQPSQHSLHTFAINEVETGQVVI